MFFFLSFILSFVLTLAQIFPTLLKPKKSAFYLKTHVLPKEEDNDFDVRLLYLVLRLV